MNPDDVGRTTLSKSNGLDNLKNDRPRRMLGLVVPIFDQGGGVPSVAMFARRVALASGRYDVRLFSLASARDDGHSWRITAPIKWRGHPSLDARTWSGIEFEHVGAFMPEFEFQRYRRRRVLTRALAECDLIQVVCGSPAWANSVIGLGKPVALQVATRARVERRLRDANPRGLTGWWRKRMTSITDRMDDAALRRVDAIQVENPWMLDYARQVTSGRDIDLRYAPPGVDASRLRPTAPSARFVSPYVLCVGRLDDSRKNIGLLLEAYAKLPETVRSQVRLVLAGTSGPSAAFWKRVETAGLRERVSYVAKPSDEQLLELYQQATVFALSSDEEGLGVVLLEAMACGVPVVATRCGGPDGIITDETDGYLVPLNDAEAMSARLLRLLQDAPLNETMGRSARLTIERRYDERVTGSVFLDMWDRLLRKPGAC